MDIVGPFQGTFVHFRGPNIKEMPFHEINGLLKIYRSLLIAGPTNIETWSLLCFFFGVTHCYIQYIYIIIYICRNLSLQKMWFAKFPSCARPMRVLKVQGSIIGNTRTIVQSCRRKIHRIVLNTHTQTILISLFFKKPNLFQNVSTK